MRILGIIPIANLLTLNRKEMAVALVAVAVNEVQAALPLNVLVAKLRIVCPTASTGMARNSAALWKCSERRFFLREPRLILRPWQSLFSSYSHDPRGPLGAQAPRNGSPLPADAVLWLLRQNEVLWA